MSCCPVTSAIIGRGDTDTLFATADGKVKFGLRKGRKLVDILTADT